MDLTTFAVSKGLQGAMTWDANIDETGALEYVKNQTEEICKLAVQEWDGALEYVKDEYKTIVTML